MRSGLVGWFKSHAKNPLIYYVIAAVLLMLLIGHHLGSQPAGLSQTEALTRSHSQSLRAILNNPINAPHNLLALGLHAAGLAWKTALRLSSALFAFIFLYCFYLIVRAWFSAPIGLMGTVLLAATPLFLVSARQGSAEIMYFSVTALIAVYLAACRAEKKDKYVIGLAALAALLVYTPGLIWWLVGALIICRRKLAGLIELASPPANLMAVGLLAALLAPLGYAVAKNLSLAKQLALIPTHLGSVILTLKHLVWMDLAFLIRAPYHNPLILGRQPILDILQIALLAFGSYALWSAAKTKLLALYLSVAFVIILAGLNNDFSILALGLPALALIICAGLRYLFIEWRGVFPKNPLAKTLALSLMWALVIVQLLFGIRYAVIAWPNTVDTKTAYVLK